MSDSNENSNAITISAWVKRNGSQINYSGVIFFRDGATSSGIDVLNNKLAYHWNDAHYAWDSGLTLPDGDWVFVALSVEPTQATMYMGAPGGILQSSVNVAAHGLDNLSAAAMSVGMDPYNGGRHYKGDIDDVRVFDKSLSSAELQSLASSYLGNSIPVVTSGTYSVDENIVGSTAITSVAFTDADAGDTHTFAITAGNTGNAFQIDGSGNITTLGAVDFEAIASYSLTVTVTDDGSPNQVGSAVITVNINDIAADDSDSDGMDDAWELANLTSTTASDGTGDADADGQNDAHEYAAGTSPTDSTDTLVITELVPTVTDATVKWAAKNGKSYKIRYSYDLDTWHDAVTGQASGADGEMTYLDTDGTRASASKVFYKVEVE